MIANEVNKFEQIFPIHKRRKYKVIGIGVGNFHPFVFTPKSNLRRNISFQGYSTFFFQTYFRIIV
jgi:hypothetical protein